MYKSIVVDPPLFLSLSLLQQPTVSSCLLALLSLMLRLESFSFCFFLLRLFYLSFPISLYRLRNMMYKRAKLVGVNGKNQEERWRQFGRRLLELYSETTLLNCCVWVSWHFNQLCMHGREAGRRYVSQHPAELDRLRKAAVGNCVCTKNRACRNRLHFWASRYSTFKSSRSVGGEETWKVGREYNVILRYDGMLYAAHEASQISDAIAPSQSICVLYLGVAFYVRGNRGRRSRRSGWVTWYRPQHPEWWPEPEVTLSNTK